MLLWFSGFWKASQPRRTVSGVEEQGCACVWAEGEGAIQALLPADHISFFWIQRAAFSYLSWVLLSFPSIVPKHQVALSWKSCPCPPCAFLAKTCPKQELQISELSSSPAAQLAKASSVWLPIPPIPQGWTDGGPAPEVLLTVMHEPSRGRGWTWWEARSNFFFIDNHRNPVDSYYYFALWNSMW